MVDIALDIADEYILDGIYARFYPISITDNTTTILQSSLPQLMKHPKFLKNQIRKEITLSVTGFPLTSLVTVPWFLGEVRGYSKLYDNINDYGFLYGIFSIILYLFFTDMCIYWIHRWLHHPLIYKILHKPHHRWIVPTPYSSHAFHPLDGYLQSCLFVFVNLWTIMIHDGKVKFSKFLSCEYLSSGSFINGAAHHALHHLYFNYNYGQYFTLWDKICGSHRFPSEEQFDRNKKRDQKVWIKQAIEVDNFDENGKEKEE
ncbi:5902_t:CDS:2 [Dentiscutata heterogama]|uniref:5902_t:CDS:1 n=1 Tax=Dentiscutata heterogama TaxID=1316150 RepID=A0ACA9MIG9_9GLOM|nr:5902_t:CDS:2 [Dentiscutata heterogama]